MSAFLFEFSLPLASPLFQNFLFLYNNVLFQKREREGEGEGEKGKSEKKRSKRERETERRPLLFLLHISCFSQRDRNTITCFILPCSLNLFPFSLTFSTSFSLFFLSDFLSLISFTISSQKHKTSQNSGLNHQKSVEKDERPETPMSASD